MVKIPTSTYNKQDHVCSHEDSMAMINVMHAGPTIKPVEPSIMNKVVSTGAGTGSRIAVTLPYRGTGSLTLNPCTDFTHASMYPPAHNCTSCLARKAQELLNDPPSARAARLSRTPPHAPKHACTSTTCTKSLYRKLAQPGPVDEGCEGRDFSCS